MYSAEHNVDIVNYCGDSRYRLARVSPWYTQPMLTDIDIKNILAIISKGSFTGEEATTIVLLQQKLQGMLAPGSYTQKFPSSQLPTDDKKETTTD